MTSKGSDQTAPMRRLVRAFAGRIYHIVGNLRSRLIFTYKLTKDIQGMGHICYWNRLAILIFCTNQHMRFWFLHVSHCPAMKARVPLPKCADSQEPSQLAGTKHQCRWTLKLKFWPQRVKYCLIVSIGISSKVSHFISMGESFRINPEFRILRLTFL